MKLWLYRVMIVLVARSVETRVREPFSFYAYEGEPVDAAGCLDRLSTHVYCYLII